MGPSNETATFLRLFVEAICFGILFVTTGHCLRQLLFQPNKLILRKARGVKWWAVCVVILMLLLASSGLGIDLWIALQAFVSRYNFEATDDFLNEIQDWSNIARDIIYACQVLVADGILVYRLFVIYGRSMILKVVVLGLFVPLAIAAGAVLIVIGNAGNILRGPNTDEYIEIGLLCLELLFNGFVTSLIVYKLWKTRAGIIMVSTAPDKWLGMIRIIIESGVLYLVSVILTLVCEPVGSLTTITGGITIQTISIATVLLISRIHEMLQDTPDTHELHAISISSVNNMTTASETSIGDVIVLGSRSDKSSVSITALGPRPSTTARSL